MKKIIQLSQYIPTFCLFLIFFTFGFAAQNSINDNGISPDTLILVESFDDHTTLNSWQNGGSSSTLATSDDVVEGTGSLDWIYEIVAGESWGGSYDIQINPENTYHLDLSAMEGLGLNYKVLEPADQAGVATFNVKLFIESTGGTEQWHYSIPALLDDSTGEWQDVLIPFDSFDIPGWETVYDSVLYLDKLTEIQMQVIVGSDAPTTSGRFLLDNLTGYGYKEEDDDDKKYPVPPGVINTNGSFEDTAPGPVTDLENGVEGWLLQLLDGSAANFEIVEDPVQDGNHSLKVVPTTLGANQWSIQAVGDSIPVHQGGRYRLSVWAKSDVPGIQINVTVGNYSFNEYNAIRPANLTAGEWREFAFNFTVTDNVQWIRVPIHFNYAANTNNAIYIDNLQVIDLDLLDLIAKPVIVQAESGLVGDDFEILEENEITYVRITNDGWDISDPSSPDWASIWSKPISQNHVITYEVTFPAPGEYNLFVRARVGSDGADDDSFFYPNGFGEKDVENPDDWRIANQMDVGGYTLLTDVVNDRGGAGTQVWKWLNISQGNFHHDGITFIVEEGALTQTFQIGGRETGFDIDRFAFGRADLYYTVKNLDDVEPGSTELEPVFIYEGPPLATGHPKFLGNIYSPPQVPVSPPLFESYWNQVTPENAGKWGSVEGTRDNMNWIQLDAAYNLAKDNGWPFRFHVLVWGSQQPTWITSLTPEEQLEEIEEWFTLVAERYPDIDFLEVVNEPIPAPPPYTEALGGSGATGYDWIITAFQMARDIFPASTKLMINEYGIISGGAKLNTYLGIINLLIERDLLDGIGIQGHYFSTTGSTANMVTSLDRLAETGLPIQVTEFDLSGLTDDAQLQSYQRVFPPIWEHPAVEGVTLWGWRLGSWRPEQMMHLVNSDGSERPALTWLREYVQSTVSVDIVEELPQAFRLYNNYPNPFNPSTQIMYTIPQASDVTLRVYDILGRLVQTLVDEAQSPGQYTVTFNANNLSSGIYLYRLEAGTFVQMNRMILIK
jgi:endo-1,4-beta-xylanase